MYATMLRYDSMLLMPVKKIDDCSDVARKIYKPLQGKLDKDTYDDLCIEFPKLTSFDDPIYSSSCIACTNDIVYLAWNYIF